MKKNSSLQLQYGINMHAQHVYDEYQPLKTTSTYPDPFSSELRQKLANYAGVPAEMITCGNGSDELIDLYIRMHKLLNEDLKVAIAPPMYFQYPLYASRVGATVINLPHDRSLITPEHVAKYGGNPRDTVVMLDNASNPAGDLLTREQIIALLDAGYELFIDEAYYEFSHQTVVDLISTYPKQLVVSRTLSKMGAMAGSRLGYVVADPAIIAQFNLQRNFFNVNIEAQHRGLFVLDHMKEFEQAIDSMREVKTHTLNALKKLKTYEVFPSLDLFVIFKHKKMPTPELHERLKNDFHIDTYLFDNFKGYSVIRAATGQQDAMDQLVSAAAELA